MNTCKSCKWWEKGGGVSYVELPNAGKCNHAAHKADVLVLHMNDFCIGSTKDVEIAYMEVDANITGPEYGCVHHVLTNAKGQRDRI